MVCLAGLGLSDLWAEAGLMPAPVWIRESVRRRAGHAGMNGDFFADRTATNAWPSPFGKFPGQLSNTWLRLNRVGNVFTGFGSYDGSNGRNWAP